MVRRVFELE